MVDTRTEQVTDYRVGQEIRICITAVISILLLLGLLGVGGRAGRFVSDALFGSFEGLRVRSVFYRSDVRGERTVIQLEREEF